MNYIEAVYQSQADLKTFSIQELRQLAKSLGLGSVDKDDLVWLLAVKLLSTHYQYAKMSSKVNYGKFTDQLCDINKKYSGIAERFQVFANEAGIGGKEAREFDGEAFIQYAIDNNITDKSIDEIYSHQVQSKLMEADIMEFTPVADTIGDLPLSRNDKQCTSMCIFDPNNNCYCQTDPYKGWTGIFTWDYCQPNKCSRAVNV